jgi:hypothetical protein
MARREIPLRGRGDDTVDYRAVLSLILAGDVTELHETIEVVGQRNEPFDIFVEDPRGNVVIDDGEGGTVRGRIERRTVRVPVTRLTRIEVEDRRAPSEPGGQGGPVRGQGER